MKRWKIAGISMLALIVGLAACDDKDDPAESEGTLQGSWIFQSSTLSVSLLIFFSIHQK